MIRESLACVLVLSCATPRSRHEASRAPVDGHDPDQTTLAELRGQVEHLVNRVNHLETEIKAASSEGEFTRMTIDGVYWSGDSEVDWLSPGHPDEPVLFCHLVEWNGYPRMLRFTRKADPRFYLRAPGREPIEVEMAAGGICNDKGDTRLVILPLGGQSSKLERGVEYSLRPRNEVGTYTWVVSNDVVVVRK